MDAVNRPDGVERLAAVLFERFSPGTGPFGKSPRLWSRATPNLRESWRTAAKEILDKVNDLTWTLDT